MDKINRFLQPQVNQGKSKTTDKIARFLAVQKSSASEQASTRRISWCEPEDGVSTSTRKSQYAAAKSQTSESSSTSRRMDMPPVAEISVIPNNVDKEAQVPVTMPGVSLPPDLVKEIFPYHIVLDSSFRIIQTGNNLEMLIQVLCILSLLICGLWPMPSASLMELGALVNLCHN